MIVVENRDYPFASLSLYLLAGGRFDPPGKEGLSYLTGQMLLRGAGDRDHAAFSESVERLGGSLDVGVGRESTCIEGDTLTRNLDPWLDLLGDALQRPRFEQSELDRLRRQTQAENEERLDSDEDLCGHVFFQALHRPDPAGRAVKGTRESLARITRDDVVARYERLVTGELVAGVCGDVPEDFPARLRERLPVQCELRGGQPPFISQGPRRVRVILLDKPDRTQTQIAAGHLSIPANHHDYYPLMMGNTIFGGTFTARLSREIREKRGWSYGAYSTLAARRDIGSWSFRYYPAMKDTVDALALGLELTHQLVDDGVTEEEVAFAQSYLVNHHPFHLQTPRRRLMEALRLRLLGLPDDTTARYVANVRGVTADAVNEALRAHLTPRELTVVIVCTAAPIADRIAALDTVDSVEVHPYDREWG